ncbi:MAG TPA: CDP-alcohol phosphatidyltransferase family protein [Vicinamibacterales bacterium]
MKTAAVAAAIAAAAALGLRDHHPFPRFGPANLVTSFRALLVAAVAGLIGEPHGAPVAWTAVWLGLAATLLDGADGWLARRTGMISRFGARFDVEVDALLIQVLAILAWRHGKAGAWVLFSGLLRYLFVAAGWALEWMRQPLSPTIRGKVTCVVQIGGLLIALSPIVSPPLSDLVAAAALIALTGSFAIDVNRLWRQYA